MKSGFVNTSCSAFLEEHLIASGPLEQVVLQVKDVVAEDKQLQVLIFNDSTSKQIEVDFRGTTEVVMERLLNHPDATAVEGDGENKRRVGRPKLGVIAGEVTLLPRHWDWLKSQPGGASVTLRKLVDEARRVREKQDTMRGAQEVTYRFMTALAGNLSNYEESLRALYASDATRFYELVDGWPADIRNHIKKLADNAFPG
jgi:uncharacterized protein